MSFGIAIAYWAVSQLFERWATLTNCRAADCGLGAGCLSFHSFGSVLPRSDANLERLRYNKDLSNGPGARKRTFLLGRVVSATRVLVQINGADHSRGVKRKRIADIAESVGKSEGIEVVETEFLGRWLAAAAAVLHRQAGRCYPRGLRAVLAKGWVRSWTQRT